MKTISSISEIGKIEHGTKYEFFVSDYNEALQIAQSLKDTLQAENPNDFFCINPFTPTKQVRVFTVADYASQEYRVHISFDKNYEEAQKAYKEELETEYKDNAIINLFK